MVRKMVRPLKTGLDYFPLDIDIMEEPSVGFVDAKYGLQAFGLLVRLLMRIYRNGYFLPWNERELVLFATKDIGLDIELTKTIVTSYIEEGFFNADLYTRFGIITSRGVQKRYLRACDRRSKVAIYQEYFLLDPQVDDVKLENVTLMPVNVSNNPVSAHNMQTETTQRKENIEQNESKTNHPSGEGNGQFRDSPTLLEDNPEFADFWRSYPRREGRGRAFESWKAVVSDGQHPRDLSLAAAKYAVSVMKTERQFIKMAHNFLAGGFFAEYLPVPSPPKPCNDCAERYRCYNGRIEVEEFDESLGRSYTRMDHCPHIVKNSESTAGRH